MQLQFKCVKIRRYDGEKPKLGKDGKPIVHAKIVDGKAVEVTEMEPASCFTIELVPVAGAESAAVWGDHPLVGKLELNRIKSAGPYVEGKVYTLNIAG